MDWKQEVLKRLDTFAEKLGTTGQYLWRILVRQEIVTGCAQVVIGIVLFVVALYFNKMRIRYVQKGPFDDLCDTDQALRVVSVSMAWLSLLIGFCFVVAGVLGIVNPEYYALRNIFWLVKGGN